MMTAICSQFLCRGRATELRIELSNTGKKRNRSCEINSGSSNTESRTGELPRKAEVLICSGADAQLMKSKAACLLSDSVEIPLTQWPIIPLPGTVPKGSEVYFISPTTLDLSGSSSMDTKIGQKIAVDATR